jgi:hypothetical protein
LTHRYFSCWYLIRFDFASSATADAAHGDSCCCHCATNLPATLTGRSRRVLKVGLCWPTTSWYHTFLQKSAAFKNQSTTAIPITVQKRRDSVLSVMPIGFSISFASRDMVRSVEQSFRPSVATSHHAQHTTSLLDRRYTVERGLHRLRVSFVRESDRVQLFLQ